MRWKVPETFHETGSTEAKKTATFCQTISFVPGIPGIQYVGKEEIATPAGKLWSKSLNPVEPLISIHQEKRYPSNYPK
jgi:hypothetical protein